MARSFLAALAILAIATVPANAAVITVDGDIGDWTALGLVMTSPITPTTGDLRITAYGATIVGGNFYAFMETSELASAFARAWPGAWIDADRNTSTQLGGGVPAETAGMDLLLEWDLDQSTPGLNYWGAGGDYNKLIGPVTGGAMAKAGHVFEWSAPVSDIVSTLASLPAPYNVGSSFPWSVFVAGEASLTGAGGWGRDYGGPIGVRGWRLDQSGDWSVATNWAGGVPNGVDATAIFGGAILSARSVSTASAVKVGTLVFDNVNSYTIAVAGPNARLTMEAAGNAAIDVASGAHAIDLPLTFASNTEVDVESGAKLYFSDSVTAGEGIVVTKTGNGTLLVESSWTGGAVSVVAGTLEARNARALPAGHRLTIGAGGTVVLAGGLSAAAGQVSNLSAAGGGAAAVPEPSSLALLGIAILGMLARGAHRRATGRTDSWQRR